LSIATNDVLPSEHDLLPADIDDFARLGLIDPLLRAISVSGYTSPTPIQAQAIPLVLEGRDLLAAAQTGTGKTAGFTLPVLQRLSETGTGKKRRPGYPRALVLAPTRELAAQVEASVRTYSKYMQLRTQVVFGGVKITRQINALRKPVDILIATPGRLLDLVGQNYIDLSRIELLVFDEADRMLDMGFAPDVKRIVKLIPKERQTLLFSATFSKGIRTLAKSMLNNPREVSVARHNTASELVKQSAYLVDKPGKRALLALLIKENQWAQVLVFTKTKHGANKLAIQLAKEGIKADAIHSNKSQAARTKALNLFKHGHIQALVATDIAARGLDIKLLPNVVNYELPHVAEDYVHRIGRTGRAGTEGEAVSLVDADELKLLRAIERLIKKDIKKVDVEGHTGHVEAPKKQPTPAKKRARSQHKKRAGKGPRQATENTQNSRRRSKAPGGKKKRATRRQPRVRG